MFQWLLRALVSSAAEDEVFSDDYAACPHCGQTILRYESNCRWCQVPIESSTKREWWVDKPEEVKLRYGVFDVTRAKQIIVAKPRPVHYVDTSEFERPSPDSEIDIVPLDIPIIFGSYYDELCLIDGRKRIAYAVTRTQPCLQAVFLTAHETLTINRRS